MESSAGSSRAASSRERPPADLALQVLRGADPDNLPIVREGTNRPMLDHAQLSRFGVPEKRLPPDSIVINRPATLFERYRGMLWAFVTAIAALAVLLVLSWLYIVSQQRLKRGLRQSEERLSLALASTASGIWEYHPKTREAFYDEPLVHHAGLRARRPSLGVPKLGRPPAPRRP